MSAVNDANTARLLALARLKKQVGETTNVNTPAATTVSSNDSTNTNTPEVVTKQQVVQATNTSVAPITSTTAMAAAQSLVSNAAVATNAETPVSNAPSKIDTYVLNEAIVQLNNALLTSHPSMPVLLRTIHKQLRDDPELVTILSEEELGIIVNCLKKQTNTEIVASVVKGSKGTGKKKPLTLDMF